MIGVAMYITIKSLWERHKNKSLIARLTGHDWKTVAKKIKEIEEGKEYLAKKPHLLPVERKIQTKQGLSLEDRSRRPHKVRAKVVKGSSSRNAGLPNKKEISLLWQREDKKNTRKGL